MADRSWDAFTSDEHLAAIVARRGASAAAMAAAHDACRRLYDRYSRRLLAFLATRARREDLDDIHQEVWKTAWNVLPEQFDGQNFRAWLYRIARSRRIDLARKKRPEPLGDDDARPDPNEVAPDEPLIEQERMAALKRCLDQLGTVAAELVRARLGGEGYAEICRRLDVTPAKAHKLFHQAKAYLQTCLEQARA